MLLPRNPIGGFPNFTATTVLLAPPAIDPHTAADLPEFDKATAQLALDTFPKSLRRNHLSVILAKSEASGLEFASLAIEVDGKMVTTGENYLTSHSKTHVDGKDYFRLFQQAASDLHSEEGISPSGTLKIYSFHTHPTRVEPSFLIRSVNSVHEDGRPYTMTNDNDWKSFQDQFHFYVQELRKAGWTGPIEMAAGALPAQNADSAAWLDPALAKEPYVTVTTLRVEASSGRLGSEKQK
jgi:hypothetical protein